MSLNFKTCCMLALGIAVFFSGIFCCCFENMAQAEEPIPSCHQTTHDTESSKSTEECDCDQSSVVLKKEALKTKVLEIVSFLSIDNQSKHAFYIAVLKIDYHAPPIFYDTFPLYIKHSVLRI